MESYASRQIISSLLSKLQSVNPQVTGLVEASSVGVAPHHEDLGGAGVVEPPVFRLEEEVGALTPASSGLT